MAKKVKYPEAHISAIEIAGLTIKVSTIGTIAAPGSRLKSYELDYGDGTPKILGTGAPPSPFAAHTYVEPALYRIVFKVWDFNSYTDTDTREITVAKPVDPPPIPPPPPPDPIPDPPPPPPPGPLPPSDNNTMVPPASAITDAGAHRWTIGAGAAILRDGVQAAAGLGTKLLWWNGYVYTYGIDRNWWQWNGTTWIFIGAQQPGTTPVQPPPLDPPPPLPVPWPAGPTSAPLIQRDHIKWNGVFLPPDVSTGGQYSFDFISRGIAYNPGKKSLLLPNHVYEQKICEMSIPIATKDLSSYASVRHAQLVQPLTDLSEGHGNGIGAGGVQGSHVEMGGVLVHQNRVIVSRYEYYDAMFGAVYSHYSSGMDFAAQGDFRGMFRIGEWNPGFTGGYMCLVPPEWQTLIGAPALTGQAALAIIGRSSLGPAFFAFDPAGLNTGGVLSVDRRAHPTPRARPMMTRKAYLERHFAQRTPDALGRAVRRGEPYARTAVPGQIAGKPIVAYPHEHPTLGTWEGIGTQNLFYNMAAAFVGIVWPIGTRSVLVFGSMGTGIPCYGAGGAVDPTGGTEPFCYDPLLTAKGTHAYPYKPWIEAYDANDFGKVLSGTLQPWDLKPYAVFACPVPNPDEFPVLTAAGYNVDTGQIYVVQESGVQMLPGHPAYAGMPLISVLQLAM